MTQTLSKYHARSPRYILQPQDNTLVRIAGPSQTPWEEGTEIKNISLSGLGFVAPMELCPIVGEFIKIQFEVPNSEQMACFGLVTRLEPMNETQVEVGVQFYKLEMPHRIALLQGLAQRLKDQHQKHHQKDYKRALRQRLIRDWRVVAFMVFALVTWISLMIWTWRL